MANSEQERGDILNFKRIVIIAGIVLFLVAGNAIYALLNNGNQDDNNQQSTSQSQTNNPLGVDTNAVQGDYQVTISVTSANGTISESVAKVDGTGNIAMTVQSAAGQTEMRVIDDSIYSKDANGKWMRVPVGGSGSSADDILDREINLGFSTDELADLTADKVTSKGKADCRSGTCRIYEYTNQKQEKAIIKVDDATNRVSEIEVTSSDGEVSRLAYEYNQAVEVIAPSDFTDMTQ